MPTLAGPTDPVRRFAGWFVGHGADWLACIVWMIGECRGRRRVSIIAVPVTVPPGPSAGLPLHLRLRPVG